MRAETSMKKLQLAKNRKGETRLLSDTIILAYQISFRARKRAETRKKFQLASLERSIKYAHKYTFCFNVKRTITQKIIFQKDKTREAKKRIAYFKENKQLKSEKKRTQPFAI